MADLSLLLIYNGTCFTKKFFTDTADIVSFLVLMNDIRNTLLGHGS